MSIPLNMRDQVSHP